MSLYDWRYAIAQVHADAPFEGLIMAAVLRADSDNFERLRAVFPELHAEASERYHAPGGLLATEKEST